MFGKFSSNESKQPIRSRTGRAGGSKPTKNLGALFADFHSQTGWDSRCTRQGGGDLLVCW